MLLARLSFALGAQALATCLLGRGRWSRAAWRAAGAWWTVWGTLADLGSLGALAWLARREGTHLAVLGSLDRRRVGGGEVLRGLGAVLALAPAVGASALVTRVFYRGALPPQVSLPRDLLAWATTYSVLVWPAVWGFAEETTYLGYALPRLEARTGHTWPSVGAVALAWALQHLALPFLPDRRYLAARVLSALPVTAATTALYVVTGRRLPAMMVAHWLADLPTALVARATEPT